MCYSNDRCYSAPSSPDRAPNLELGGTKFDSWGRSDGRFHLTSRNGIKNMAAAVSKIIEIARKDAEEE